MVNPSQLKNLFEGGQTRRKNLGRRINRFVVCLNCDTQGDQFLLIDKAIRGLR